MIQVNGLVVYIILVMDKYKLNIYKNIIILNHVK
jgi:hypothetical protein